MKLNKFILTSIIFIFIVLIFCFIKEKINFISTNINKTKNLENMIDIMSTNEKFRDFKTIYSKLNEKEKVNLYKYMKNDSSRVLPIYYIAVSDDILKKNKDEALLFYTIGILRSKLDVFMCEDETNIEQIIFYPSIAPKVSDYYKEIDTVNLAKIYKEFLNWDDKHPQHPNSVWICYHGITVFEGEKPSIKSDEEYLKLKKDMRISLQKMIYENLN